MGRTPSRRERRPSIASPPWRTMRRRVGEPVRPRWRSPR
jgi:hypothetical protein